MGYGAAEVTGLGFVCFVINTVLLSANRVDFGLFFIHIQNSSSFFSHTPGDEEGGEESSETRGEAQGQEGINPGISFLDASISNLMNPPCVRKSFTSVPKRPVNYR